MSQPDRCSIIRIAIALAVLNHKPKDQSIASYLLDLHSHFPVATNNDGVREWRAYALELEKQLAALKAQRDADQELLSKLPSDVSQVASISDVPPPKKKSKKNPSRDQHDPEHSWEQSRAKWSRVLSSQYPSSPSLVVAYTALKGVLASSNADLAAYASRIADAILRALSAIHSFLFSAPTLDSQPQSKPEYLNSSCIALASPLLSYVLRTVLPALVCTAQDSTKAKRSRAHAHIATLASLDAYTHVDKVLDCLLERILLPPVRAFVPLCFAHLAHLLVPPKKDQKRVRAVGGVKDKFALSTSTPAPVDPPKTADVRKDVFALVGTSLEALDALSTFVRPGTGEDMARGIKDRLGIETIRELELLYAPPSTAPQPSLDPRETHATPSEPPPVQSPVPFASTPAPTLASQQPLSRAQRLERLAGTRPERVRRLATRDAGWFLVNTLGLCVTPSPGAGNAANNRSQDTPAGRLLRDALLDRVGKLVRSASVSDGGDPPKFAIDLVCQNMLLAICERALGQLAPS